MAVCVFRQGDAAWLIVNQNACNEDLARELHHSMQVLSDIIGERITTFSYPGGRMNSKTTSRAPNPIVTQKETPDERQRKFFQASAGYALAQVIGIVASLFSFPVLTRIFSVSEYGVLGFCSTSLFIGWVVMCVQFQHLCNRLLGSIQFGLVTLTLEVCSK
jgi:hypothetical protein